MVRVSNKRKYRVKKNTLGNKLCACLLLLCGLVPMIIDHDATAFVFFSMFAVPLFFAKDNLLL